MIRNRRSILPALGAVALVGVMLLPAVPVRAASAVRPRGPGDARRPLRDRRAGGVAVAVTLVNDGTPTEGWLASDSGAPGFRASLRRDCRPALARRSRSTCSPAGSSARSRFRYEEPNGTNRVTVPVRIFEQTGDQVAVVGDGTGALRPTAQRRWCGRSAGPDRDRSRRRARTSRADVGALPPSSGQPIAPRSPRGTAPKPRAVDAPMVGS